MLRRMVVLMLVVIGLFAGRAQAQGGGFGGGGGGPGGGGGFDPGAFDPAMMQQMQQMGQQMMTNMQNAGVDPGEYFQQMGQQMRDGTFDPEAMQQEMVDKGFIDQQMLATMQQFQGQVQTATRNNDLENLRVQLNATPEEWTALLPRIKRVMAAQDDMAQSGQSAVAMRTQGMGGMGMGGGQVVSNTEVGKAWKALKEAARDQRLPEEKLAIKLREWRDLHVKAAQELDAAQQDLVSLLTLRQETLLMALGYL